MVIWFKTLLFNPRLLFLGVAIKLVDNEVVELAWAAGDGAKGAETPRIPEAPEQPESGPTSASQGSARTGNIESTNIGVVATSQIAKPCRAVVSEEPHCPMPTRPPPSPSYKQDDEAVRVKEMLEGVESQLAVKQNGFGSLWFQQRFCPSCFSPKICV